MFTDDFGGDIYVSGSESGLVYEEDPWKIDTCPNRLGTLMKADTIRFQNVLSDL